MTTDLNDPSIDLEQYREQLRAQMEYDDMQASHMGHAAAHHHPSQQRGHHPHHRLSTDDDHDHVNHVKSVVNAALDGAEDDHITRMASFRAASPPLRNKFTPPPRANSTPPSRTLGNYREQGLAFGHDYNSDLAHENMLFNMRNMSLGADPVIISSITAHVLLHYPT